MDAHQFYPLHDYPLHKCCGHGCSRKVATHTVMTATAVQEALHCAAPEGEEQNKPESQQGPGCQPPWTLQCPLPQVTATYADAVPRQSHNYQCRCTLPP